MGNNYTPLNREALEKRFQKAKKSLLSLDTGLLLIGTLTALVLAFMLFILIQKKMQTPPSSVDTISPPVALPTIEPTLIPSPTVVLVTPTASVSATPVASPSATVTTTTIPSPTSATPPIQRTTP